MRAYQCSKCKLLQDFDERCACVLPIDARPGHREKGDAELCKENFEPLEVKKQWHAKFSWEKQEKEGMTYQ